MTRFSDAINGMMQFVDINSKADEICKRLFYCIKDDDKVTDELILLAARFHYPLSPGCDYKKQLMVLQECGYTLKESKRVLTLIESQRGLEGDPEKRMLTDKLCQIYCDGEIINFGDSDWLYGVGRLWRSASNHMKVKLINKYRVLNDNNRFPVKEKYLRLHSTVLGDSVESTFDTGCGFPNVYFPLFGHSLEIDIFDAPTCPITELDQCLSIWIGSTNESRNKVIDGLMDYKVAIEEACGENYSYITPDNIMRYIDIQSGYISETDSGLSISFGEGCEWEPEHGVGIRFDNKGNLLEVGEVG